VRQRRLYSHAFAHDPWCAGGGLVSVKFRINGLSLLELPTKRRKRETTRLWWYAVRRWWWPCIQRASRPRTIWTP